GHATSTWSAAPATSLAGARIPGPLGADPRDGGVATVGGGSLGRVARAARLHARRATACHHHQPRFGWLRPRRVFARFSDVAAKGTGRSAFGGRRRWQDELPRARRG